MFHLTFNCTKRNKRNKYSLQTTHSSSRCQKKGRGIRGDDKKRRVVKFKSLCFLIIQNAAKILLKQNMCKEYLKHNQTSYKLIANASHHIRRHFQIGFQFLCALCSTTPPVQHCSVLYFSFKFIELILHIVWFFGNECEKMSDPPLVIRGSCWTKRIKLNINLWSTRKMKTSRMPTIAQQ